MRFVSGIELHCLLFVPLQAHSDVDRARLVAIYEKDPLRNSAWILPSMGLCVMTFQYS